MRENRCGGTPSAGRSDRQRPWLRPCRRHELLPGPARPTELPSRHVPGRRFEVGREGALAEAEELAADDMVRHHHFDRAHIDRAAVLDDFTVAAQKTETLGDGRARGIDRLGRCRRHRRAARQPGYVDPRLAALRAGLEIDVVPHGLHAQGKFGRNEIEAVVGGHRLMGDVAGEDVEPVAKVAVFRQRRDKALVGEGKGERQGGVVEGEG